MTKNKKRKRERKKKRIRTLGIFKANLPPSIVDSRFHLISFPQKFSGAVILRSFLNYEVELLPMQSQDANWLTECLYDIIFLAPLTSRLLLLECNFEN